MTDQNTPNSRFRPQHRLTAPDDLVVDAVTKDDLVRDDSAPVMLGTTEVAQPSGTARERGVLIKVDELPSRRLPYPATATIHYRPYTWEEINFHSSSKLDTVDLYRDILSGIITRGITPEEITLMDFYYIALLRKMSTLGTSQFTLNYTAFGDRQVSTISFADIDFDELGVPALPARAMICGEEHLFKPITIGGYIRLLEQGISEEDMDIPFSAMCCVSLDYEDALDRFKNATGLDLLRLNAIDEAFYHSVKPVTVRALKTIDNPAYDPDQNISDTNYPTIQERKEVNVHLDSPETLILPFRGSDDTHGDLISFGL